MTMLLKVVILFLQLALLLGSDAETFFFTGQPEDAELEEGEEKKLFCSVSPPDIPGLSYTWYKSDEFKSQDSVDEAELSTFILPGERASVMYFNQVKRTDTGYYHCMVSTQNYKLFSQTAYLRVNYFTIPVEAETIQKEWAHNTDVEYLQCNTPESDPPTDVVWSKNGDVIADARMFVFPGDYGTRTRGTLMIINVDRQGDSGNYTCSMKEERQGRKYLLSIFEVTTTSGASTINRAPSLAYKSHSENVNVIAGGAITLVCAGTGYPTPQYGWTQNDIEIRGGDSMSIEDHGHRLVVSNVKDAGKYQCIMSNNADDGTTQDRPHPFYVKLISNVNDYNIDVLRVPDRYNVLKPNQYRPFTLDCSVRKTGQIQILWLKDGKRLSWNARITTDETETEIDGEVATNRNLIFENTNENDLGVYQCVMFNTERLKVETTYVTLQVDTLPYQINSRKPEYTLIGGEEGFSVDEAEEECNAKDGHLVSIMGMEENEEVLDILRANNLESVWIGLTREKPIPEGSWLWTHPGDISTSYSHWTTDKPDNKYGYQEYAVMLNDTGKWLDVDKDTKRPAVCKRYVVVCPSVDDFYDGKVRVRGWESTGAKYEVGEEVEIYCRFPGPVELPINHVTCGLDGMFQPARLDECLEGSNSDISYRSSPIVLVTSLLILVLSTL